jgi:hypothetical protein
MFRAPALQVAVESAQVLAGIVQYPPGNAFYIYHTKVWTVLHQVTALFLYAGISELAMSRVISGIMGMAALQALGMVVYALSRNVLLAPAAALVILLTGAAEGFAVYPVALIGTGHTYGALGLSLFVLMLGLYGAGCHRSAALLLGLAPSMHPGLGLWLWIVVLVALLWEGRAALPRALHDLKYVALGLTVSAASLAVHVAFMADIPDVSPAETARYLNAFVAFWDFHRAPLSLVSTPMAFNVAAMAVALAGLTALKRSLPGNALFLLRAVFVCGALGIVAVFVSWIPPEHLPRILLLLMPSRLLIVNTMMLVAVAAGLSAWMPRTKITRFAPVVLLLTCFVYKADVVLHRARWPSESAGMTDYSNEPLFAAAASEKTGLLLSGGSLQLNQLRTRRPVLLDEGGLDALPYAPESGPEMQRVLLNVYGLDLLHPPAEARHLGAVPAELNRRTWARYSRLRWQQIRRTFSVTQVLTPADWILDLPLIAENEALRLYEIPE